MYEYVAVDFACQHIADDSERCVVRSLHVKGTDDWEVSIDRLAYPKALAGSVPATPQENSTAAEQPYETLFDVIYAISKRDYRIVFVCSAAKGKYLRNFIHIPVEVLPDAVDMSSLFALCCARKKKENAKCGWEDPDYYVPMGNDFKQQQQQQQLHQQQQHDIRAPTPPPFPEKFKRSHFGIANNGPVHHYHQPPPPPVFNTTDDDGYVSMSPRQPPTHHYASPAAGSYHCKNPHARESSARDESKLPRNYCLIHAFACRDYHICVVLNHSMDKISTTHPFCPSCQADLYTHPSKRSLVCRNVNCKFNMKIVLRRDNFGAYYRPHTLNRHALLSGC